jgi:hypothetical protein
MDLEGISIENHPTRGRAARLEDCMQRDGTPRHFSTLHRIEDKILQLEITAVMCNARNSKNSFNKKKQTGLVGG